jgi:hypothetical protein
MAVLEENPVAGFGRICDEFLGHGTLTLTQRDGLKPEEKT